MNIIFENSLPKGIFGKNIRDSPNGSLTTDSRSLQVAILKIKKTRKTALSSHLRTKNQHSKKSKNVFNTVKIRDLNITVKKS